MQDTIEKNDIQSGDPEKEYSYSETFNTEGNEDRSWSSLADRYKNLWRSRLKNRNYKRGIRNALATGGLSTVLFILMSPAYPIFGSILYFYLGSIFGSAFAGYKNDLDVFGGFHIGLVSSTLLMSFFIGASFLVNPMGTILITPILLFYLFMMSICHAIYAGIGKQI
jgi:hypothetical protein